MKVRPCRFAMTLRISEYFSIGNTAFAVTKVEKSLSQKGACQKLAGRRGWWRFSVKELKIKQARSP